jgi:hypothetical protein
MDPLLYNPVINIGKKGTYGGYMGQAHKIFLKKKNPQRPVEVGISTKLQQYANSYAFANLSGFTTN